MISRDGLEHILEYAKQQRHIGLPCKVPPEDMVEIMERLIQISNSRVNDATTGKPLTIPLPDISSKAFWSGAGKTEVFHPETYKRWVKEAIEQHCAIARIDVEVK